MLPLLIWVAAVTVIAVIYLLGAKAMLVGLVVLGLLGMRAVWNRPSRRQ
jgi:hypothetical protein